MKKSIVAVLLACVGMSVEAKTVWYYWQEAARRYITDTSGWTLRVEDIEIDGVKGIGTVFQPLVTPKSKPEYESQGTDGDLDFTTITNAAGQSIKFIRFGGYLCMGGFDINKSQITSVVAPDLMDFDVNGDGYEFEKSATYITNMVLSSEVRTISQRLIMGAKNLQHFAPTYFPKLTRVGALAFSGVANLPALDCPALEVLGMSAFQSTTMPSINMPKICDIGVSCFYNSQIAGDCDFPCLTNVSGKAQTAGAFQGSLLSSIKATNIVSIGAHAFHGMPNLTNFTAGVRLETIDVQAFYADAALKRFEPYLPKSLKTIGILAFSECQGLVSDLEWEIPANDTIPESFFQNTATTNYVFKSPIATVDSYAFKNLPRGSKLWFYSGCPTFNANSIQTAYPRSYVYFGVGSKNADCRAAWNALAAESPIDDTDRARADFPKKAIGKFCRNTKVTDAYCYVVPFRLKEGLSVLIR